MSTDMTEKEIWDELVSFTGSEYAAAGIMGNLYADSGLSSNNLQGSYESKLGYTDETYTSAVDSGTYSMFTSDSAGYGIAQWSTEASKKGLLDYATATGSSIGSVNTQVGYLEKQLSSDYLSTLSDLKSSTSVEDASNKVLSGYATGQDQSAVSQSKRSEYAKNFYDKYAGAVPTVSSGAELSDTTLEVDPDSLEEVCTQWSQKILSIDLESIDVNSIYAPLTGVGVATSYIPSLANALTKCTALTLTVSNLVKEAGQQQAGVDDTYSGGDNGGNNTGGNNNGGNYNGGNNNGGNNNGGNNNGGNNSGGNNPAPINPLIKPDTDVSTSVDNTKLDITVNTNMIAALTDDYASFSGVMQALGSIAGDNLPLYLTDEKYGSKLKELILKAPNISNDLKQIITKLDPATIQLTLCSIFSENTLVTDLSKDIIYNYTEGLYETLENPDVKKADVFYSVVEDVYAGINKVLTNDNVQQAMLSVYDGDVDTDFPEQAVGFIRLCADKIAEQNNVDVETALSSADFAKTVENKMNEIGKAVSFLETSGKLQSDDPYVIYQNFIG